MKKLKNRPFKGCSRDILSSFKGTVRFILIGILTHSQFGCGSSVKTRNVDKNFATYYFEGVVFDGSTGNPLAPTFNVLVSLLKDTNETVLETFANPDGTFEMKLNKEMEKRVKFIEVQAGMYKNQLIPYMNKSDSLFFIRIGMELDSAVFNKKIEIEYRGNHYIDQRTGTPRTIPKADSIK